MIKSKRAKLYIMSVLMALEFIIAFSAIGYIQIGGATLTFANIPVFAGAMLLGPLESTALGLIFGLTSMWKAMSFYCTGIDVLFSPIQSGNPLYSVILAVGTRIVFGLLAGLIYRMVDKSSKDKSRVVTVFSSLTLLLFNTAFFILLNALFGTNILYSESIMTTLLNFAVNLTVAVI
ncbi:MAG: ECF transporter S component, partial [Lachnospiraceae bacterium]|nr:ECF transporter S component [Lachnospiraceae bacterium]